MPALSETGVGVLEPGEFLLLDGHEKPTDAGEVVMFRVSSREDDHHGLIVIRKGEGHPAHLLEGVVQIGMRPA